MPMLLILGLTMNKYRLGIHIGGTTIDYAVVDNQAQIIAWHKLVVTTNIESSIIHGLKELLTQTNLKTEHCSSIHLGTTLALNSLLELRNLSRVGLMRLAGHHPDLPPAYHWPKLQRETILAGYVTVPGGREYNNKPISLLNKKSIIDGFKQLEDKGMQSLGIIGVFAPLYPEEECRAQEIIQDYLGHPYPITLSHQLSGLGFIDRENSTLINATLKQVMRAGFEYLTHKLKTLGFHGDCFITQNNGTLFTLNESIEFPVRTLASGPTNSLIGACKLGGCSDAIVVDIGGTSTDIGIVENNFPRYSSRGASVAGIPLNLLAPDIHALAMGGGSVINENTNSIAIGPHSIGPLIFKDSLTFGGKILTLFDVGNKLNNIAPAQGKIPNINSSQAKKIMEHFLQEVVNNIETIPTRHKLPILLVGGGSQNIPEEYCQNKFIRPPHFQVANAYGAALSEISHTVDTIAYLQTNREKILQDLELQAIEGLVKKGAKQTAIRIIDKKLLPLYYMPNQMTRVIITAAAPKDN